MFINGGTVTFDSCTITGNSAGNSASSVRAHAQKFPSPRWEFLADMQFDSRHSIGIKSCFTREMCVLMFESSHRPDGKIADALAPTHACTTANASVNYRMYVLQRPCKLPIAPMGISHVSRLCLQGGGVHIYSVYSATVSFSSCTITGNTAQYVRARAHAQKFPSPRWDFHMFCACACRAAVSSSMVAR